MQNDPIVIVGAARTPMGGFQGDFASLTASDLGAVVNAALLPVDAGTADWAQTSGQVAADAALAGGEDYELLFAVPARKRRRFHAAVAAGGDIPVTRIGRLTKAPGLWREDDGQHRPLTGGFSHF